MALHPESDLRNVTTAHVVSNILTPYMLVRFELGAASLRVEWSDAWLGLIPIRRRRLEVPDAELLRIGRAHRFFPSRLVTGLLLGVMVWFSPLWLQLPLAVLAFVLVIMSYVGTVRIERRTATTTIPVCLLLRGSLDRFIGAVEAGRRPGGVP